MKQTDAVIAAGALEPLKTLLRNAKANIVKEAAWTVSNITAGNVDQIQHVIDADIFPLVRIILEKGDVKSQKEAAWIITNTTFSGRPEQVIQLIQKYDILAPYCNLLSSGDIRSVKVILTGLTHFFELAEQLGGLDSFCILIEENGCLDKLERLQYHENEEVYKKSVAIIEAYFNDETVIYFCFFFLMIELF